MFQNAERLTSKINVKDIYDKLKFDSPTLTSPVDLQTNARMTFLNCAKLKKLQIVKFQQFVVEIERLLTVWLNIGVHTSFVNIL